jgi:hypothetical protein
MFKNIFVSQHSQNLSVSKYCVAEQVAHRLTCFGNAEIGFYKLERQPTPELCPSECPSKNPFLSDLSATHEEAGKTNVSPFLSSPAELICLWRGFGMALLPATQTREERDRWGRIETAELEIAIPRIASVPQQIDTGIWCLIQWRHLDDLQAGEVKAINRHLPTLIKMTVDISKPIPFSPVDAIALNWLRGVQC